MAENAPHQHDHGPDGHAHAGHPPHHHHDHDHSHDGDTYYLDQLCMVGLAGTAGVIGICLYFWRTEMLQSLLGPQFHLFVLVSGIALVVIALARAAHLWAAEGQRTPAHDHHAHDHVHDHTHEHGEACCGHDHAHDHAHSHAHGHHHDHDAGDHSHDWAPWRYVVMLVPIVLFLLGIPTREMVDRALMFKAQMAGAYEPDLGAGGRKRDPAQDAARYAGLVGLFDVPLAQAGEVYGVLREEADAKAQGEPVDFRTLEGMAANAGQRAFWDGKMVEIRGQFSPNAQDPRVFYLVRFRISCCAADAIPLRVPMICTEPVTGVTSAEWVKVTGRVEFRQGAGGGQTTVLIVPRRASVEKCAPDLNPYIQ